MRDPSGDLVMKFARSRGPFAARAFADRYGLGVSMAEGLLARLTEEGRLIEGEFRPGGTEREWVDADVLRVDPAPLARPTAAAKSNRSRRTRWRGSSCTWHGIGRGPAGLDALLDAVEQLQGAPIPASVLEREILPARVANYQPRDARRAHGRRRSDVDRRRATRRSRRPHRALPHRPRARVAAA